MSTSTRHHQQRHQITNGRVCNPRLVNVTAMVLPGEWGSKIKTYIREMAHSRNHYTWQTITPQTMAVPLWTLHEGDGTGSFRPFAVNEPGRWVCANVVQGLFALCVNIDGQTCLAAGAISGWTLSVMEQPHPYRYCDYIAQLFCPFSCLMVNPRTGCDLCNGRYIAALISYIAE